MKRLFTFSFKLFTSLLLTLFLLEIGLRLFPGVIPLDLLVLFAEKPRAEIAHGQGLLTRQDTVLLNRDDGGPPLRIPKPFTNISFRPAADLIIQIRLDEVGFCNPAGDYQRPQIDIITLGDSFATCQAVYPHETWTTQLGLLTGYSTYNLGRAGVGIQEYLQIFKKFGLQKSPRLVIMNIYEGNDLRDARKYFDHRQGKPEETEPEPVRETFLRRYSYAANLISALVTYGNISFPQLTGDVIKQNRNYRYQLVFPGNISIPFHDLNTEEAKQARDLRARQVEIEVHLMIVETLKAFVELAKSHNFIPIVTYIPAASTAYEANAVYENPEFSELIPWFSREQRSFFDQQDDKLGYIFIDLTSAIQAAARSYGSNRLLYYQHDIHLTPTGHVVIAKALSQRLQELTIIRK
jgi:hypothetical protein